MAEFDLAKLMKDVSKADTGREQIVYLPHADIFPDEGNGYSMTGLDELARSIEIGGLQQPLRVRPIEGDAGHYRIISGHRRHAAIGMLIEWGSKRFNNGVPCIVDNSQVSEALRELQLLLGNADNRKLTPADEAQQAERISDCIRKLEDEGFVFPGRHRDWVSKLSGMSRTKLARLSAIKNNLCPSLLEYFNKGQINEAAAYGLQKLPKEGQEAIAESCKRTGDAYFVRADAVEYCVQYADRYMKPCKCGNGDECDHHERRFVQPLRSQYNWERCVGNCCLSCSELQRCKMPCSKGLAKQKADKKAEEEERSKAKKKIERKEAKLQAQYRLAIQEEAKRVLPLIEAAGLDGRNTLPGRYSYYSVKVADVRKYAAGDFGDMRLNYESFLPSQVDELLQWADQLGCTMDFLMGRAKAPMPMSETDTEPTWRTGDPPVDGRYLCRVRINRNTNVTRELACNWRGGRWYACFDEKMPVVLPVHSWWPLPSAEAMIDDDVDAGARDAEP